MVKDLKDKQKDRQKKNTISRHLKGRSKKVKEQGADNQKCDTQKEKKHLKSREKKQPH